MKQLLPLPPPDNVNAFELTPQEAEEWYRGRDVYPQAAPVADDVLVTFQHQPIGLAKRIGSRLKNSYPRELVRDGKLLPVTHDSAQKKAHFLTGTFGGLN